MRFGKNLSILAIPQWKQCYLDYQHLKIFVSVIKQIVILIRICEMHLQRKRNEQLIDETINLQKSQKEIGLDNYIEQLKNIGQDVNAMFFDAHTKGMIINRLFLQMKLLELENQFKKCQNLLNFPLDGHQKQLLLEIVQYIYVESSYLETAKQLNLQGQRKIFKKHSKYSDGYFETPRRRNKKVLRIKKGLDKLLDNIQTFYVHNSQGASKANRYHLRQLAKKLQASNIDTFVFGTWIGICLTIFCVLIIMLIYTGKSVQTDKIFNRDFPTWRGIALFIFYIWIIGLNIFGFERYSISHRIIFQFNQHHYSTSTHLFIIAGFFSTFFLVMFAIYTLAITEMIKLVFEPYYLVLFVWGIFLIYFINPCPILSYRTRLYSLKLALKSILAIFIGVSFPAIWMTDQLVSLITPLKDLAYTICYYDYLVINKAANTSYLECSSASRIQVVFVVGAIAFSFRILQCLRQGYDKGKYFFQPEFYNTIKYIFSLITLILSFLWKAGNNNIIYSWIVFATISALYSYVWDLKMDWGLFQKGSPNKFLRVFLCYPIKSYYVIIVINFVFRMVWIVTLSPSIANNAFGSPQIFSLVTGMIEIARRGIWNMLRVEREHIANCRNFKAIPSKINTIETVIINSVNKKKNLDSFGMLENLNIINCQNQLSGITSEMKIVKESHLEILYEQVDQEIREKQERVKAAKKLKKRVTEIKTTITLMMEGPKKSNIFPAFSDF